MRFILDAHRFLFSFNYREINWRSPKTWSVLVGITIALFALFNWAFSGDEVAQEQEAGPRQVKVASVSELMGGRSGFSAIAEIQSVNEAKISPEIGGRIVRVHAALGDRVGAGKVLAEIENASQRAAVLQAEGALDAAKASVPNLGTTLESARGSAVTTLLSAYAAADSAIEDAVGQMVTDPEGSQPGFKVSTRDQAALSVIQAEIKPMSKTKRILDRQEQQAKTLNSSSNLETELATTEAELRDIRAYLDTVLRALNAAVFRSDMTEATVSAYVGNVTAARASVTQSLSAIVAARSALETASQNAQGGSGTVSSAQASLKQAEGAYHAALANLEKTIIRSPITGTLNNFTIKLGDTVSPSQQVAIVSNNNALEGVMYVTEEDKNRITVGQKVKLEGGTEGTITKIAPALDPVTRRIEVRIGLPAESTLANGASVRVTISKDPLKTQTVAGPLSIPITALRMESKRTLVFVVENNKLVAREIIIGKLSGDSVQVTSGLSLDTEIVVDARGLKEGNEVEAVRL